MLEPTHTINKFVSFSDFYASETQDARVTKSLSELTFWSDYVDYGSNSVTFSVKVLNSTYLSCCLFVRFP